jgi:hypothetical protein
MGLTEACAIIYKAVYKKGGHMKKVNLVAFIYWAGFIAICSTTAHSEGMPAGISGAVTVTNPVTNPANVMVISDKKPVVVSYTGITTTIFPDGSTERFEIPDGKVFVLTDVIFTARRTSFANLDKFSEQSMQITLTAGGNPIYLDLSVNIAPNSVIESKTYSFNTGIRFTAPGFHGGGGGGSGDSESEVLLLGYFTSE